MPRLGRQDCAGKSAPCRIVFIGLIHILGTGAIEILASQDDLAAVAVVEHELASNVYDTIAASFAAADEIVDEIVGLAVNTCDIGRNGVGQPPGKVAANVIIPVARFHGSGTGRDEAAEVEARIGRDDIDQAAGRVASENRSLRASKHFDAVDFHEVGPGRERISLIYAVNIGRDIGLVAHRNAARSDAANDREEDARRTPAEKAGNDLREIANVGRARPSQGFGRHGGHGHRHILQLLFSPRRCNDDFPEPSALLGRLLAFLLRRRFCGRGLRPVTDNRR